MNTKNKAAHELVSLRWQTKPKTKRQAASASEAAAKLVAHRWANATPEERAAVAKIGKLGGRPRRLARCPCGAMSLGRAAKRGHKCAA